MTSMLRRWLWLLVCTGLTACAAAQPVVREEDEEQQESASFEQLCAEDGSLLPLCEGPRCGLYRCREVMARRTVGRVVPAFAEEMVLPLPGGAAQRYWGSSDGLPENSQPVFIIPWGPKPPLLPSQQKLLEEQEAERRKPHEKHHIFPQEERLKKWFESKGINIHEYTMPLLVEVHRRIHQPPPGGAWNAAWWKYRTEHPDAPKEEIMRYAGQLIYEFGLAGPVVPYYRRWTLPPPIGGD